MSSSMSFSFYLVLSWRPTSSAIKPEFRSISLSALSSLFLASVVAIPKFLVDYWYLDVKSLTFSSSCAYLLFNTFICCACSSILRLTLPTVIPECEMFLCLSKCFFCWMKSSSSLLESVLRSEVELLSSYDPSSAIFFFFSFSLMNLVMLRLGLLSPDCSFWF